MQLQVQHLDMTNEIIFHQPKKIHPLLLKDRANLRLQIIPLKCCYDLECKICYKKTLDLSKEGLYIVLAYRIRANTAPLLIRTPLLCPFLGQKT